MDTSGVFGRTRARVRDDLRDDPYLKYLLVLAVVVCGFWVWYRVSNFRSSDEFSRLLDPMVAINAALAEPTWRSFAGGVIEGRTLGATFYLYGLVVLPVYALAGLLGDLGTFSHLGGLASRWEVWNAVPAWFWTASILLSRLVTLGFALGCVYLTYRLGTRIRDRATGRLAALLLVLSFGFVRSAHEFGEDLPGLFAVLVVVWLSLRYVETGRDRTFLLGCVLGGLTIAIKVTMGVTVVVLGAALVLRARRIRDVRPLVRPKLVVGGLALGLLGIVVGFPSVLVGGPDQLIGRLVSSAAQKAGARSKYAGAPPIWVQFGTDYLAGLGLPLAVVAAGGVVASLLAPTPDHERDGIVLLLVVLVATLVSLSVWHRVEIHHLLATIPVLAVVAALALCRLDAHRPALARVVIAVLVVTTGVYAASEDLGYASDPRDRATGWIRTNVPVEASMAAYQHSSATAALPHGRPVEHFVSPGMDAYARPYAEHWNNEAYIDWLFGFEQRRSDYIQLGGTQSYFRDDLGGRYVTVARFEGRSPLDPLTDLLRGGIDTYAERDWSIAVLERADRCPESPTCPANATDNRP